MFNVKALKLNSQLKWRDLNKEDTQFEFFLNLEATDNDFGPESRIFIQNVQSEETFWSLTESLLDHRSTVS